MINEKISENVLKQIDSVTKIVDSAIQDGDELDISMLNLFVSAYSLLLTVGSKEVNIGGVLFELGDIITQIMEDTNE